jgi:hypothetical protein
MKVNVICLKWGTKFEPEYVNNLFAAINRHSTVPIKLHCFTDSDVGLNKDGIEIHPLPYDTGLEGWWNKLYLFSKDLPIPVGETIVFFDLDTLVTGNIDDILSVDVPNLVALRDFYSGLVDSVRGNNNMGSGFMMWKHGAHTHIWDRFIKNPKKVIQSIHPHGDQRWIQMNAPDRLYWQDIFPNRVVSFKVHCRDGLPKDASVVCYHGKPSVLESITQKTKSWKWEINPAPWVLEHWPVKQEMLLPPNKPFNFNPTNSNPNKRTLSAPAVKPYKTYFAMIDANRIFGMVGRCGGGYNTVWEDWSDQGRAARTKIIQEFEEGINEICGHYTKLEQSILNEGFRNPLIITLGKPVRKSFNLLPPELKAKPTNQLYLLEGTTGGSRLWVAQRHNMLVPCFVNDYTDTLMGEEITTVDQVVKYYKDKPREISFHPKHGLIESFDPNKIGYHLGVEWSEDKIVKERAPLWVKTMNKYGYYVDRLSPDVVKLLEDVGVIQPDNLRKSINGRA